MSDNDDTRHRTNHRGRTDRSASSRDAADRERTDAAGGQHQSCDGASGGRAGRSRRAHRRGHRGRKERVLHTRISEDLSDDIRRLADDLRVPVSNLVRNVLEEVFSVVESVSDSMGDAFEDVLDEAEQARERIRRHAQPPRRRRHPHHTHSRDVDVEQELRRDEEAELPHRREARDRGAPAHASGLPGILGWQPLVLDAPCACARCAVTLCSGDDAFIGVGREAIADVVLCEDCVRARRRQRADG